MRADETAKYTELVGSITELDRAAGIAFDERTQPFAMWPSITEPFVLGPDNDTDDRWLGSFGAQAMFTIASACAFVHEFWRQDLRESTVELDGSWRLPDESIWEWHLPPVAMEYATPEWMARFLQYFADIRYRIFDGSYNGPLCVGEEMALHVVLDTAKELVDDAKEFTTKDAPADAVLWDGFYRAHSSLPAIDNDVLIKFLNEAQLTHFDDAVVLCLADMPELIGEPGAATLLHPLRWFELLHPFAPDRGPGDAAALSRGWW